MEEETKSNSEVAAKEVAGSIPVKRGKKELVETSFDGEFIKIEKESYESKQTYRPSEVNNVENDQLSVTEHSAIHSSSSKELLEAHEKVNELQMELDRVANALKNSESKNAQLKDEVSAIKEDYEENGKRYEELEINHKKLQEQTFEAEQEFRSEIKSLQENLEDQVLKHQELSRVKEAFDNLNLELEGSKKKMQHLEQELKFSLSEGKKLEELHRQSALDAESKSKQAEELERLLEAAKLGAKEAEEKMASFQEEIRGLQANIVEKEKLEELLKSKSMELSLKDSLIDEIWEELKQTRASEQQLKDDKRALESQFSTTKDDLQKTVHELEDTELRLKEEVADKVEAALGSQGEALLKAQDELAIVGAEKERLESAMVNLSDTLKKMKKQHIDLETKLKLSDENLGKAEILSADALSKKTELEQKLHALQELCNESKAATEKTLQLEVSLQAANAALSERELLLDTEKHRIKELEEEVEAISKKCREAETDSKNYHDKASELVVELDKSRSATMILEKELETASERERELTESLNMATEEKRKLEEAFHDSMAKLQEGESLLEVLRTELNLTQGKLESLENDLKASGIREGDIMEKLRSPENRLEEQKSLSEKVKLLENQIWINEEQVAKAARKSASLSKELNQSSKEVASLECSNEELKRTMVVAEEKAVQSLAGNELLVGMNSQLKEKVGELEKLLESANAEKEIAVQQITSHMSKITDLTNQHTRSSEVQSETEARIVQAEVQLKETIEKLTLKELEAKELSERLNAVDGQLKLHEEKAQEASGFAESIKGKLDQTLLKVQYQAKMIEELEAKSGQREAHNGSLAEVNMKLNKELAGYESKLNDLQAKLSGIIVEKDEANELYSSSEKVIEDLTQQLASETRQLQLKISSMIDEHRQFREANKEACNDLRAELSKLKGRLKEYEVANGSLAEVNMKLSEELTGYESKLNDPQAKLSGIIVEKDEADELYSSSEEVIEDLTQQLASETLQLQLKISSMIDEHWQFREANEEACNDLWAELSKLKGKLKEYEVANEASKLELENMKGVAAEKSDLLARVNQLEERLLGAKSQLKKEVESACAEDELSKKVQKLQQELELAQSIITQLKQEEENYKHLSVKLEAKSQKVVLLEKQIKELEQKSQLDATISKETGEGVEVKSRDIGGNFSSPTNRESKKSGSLSPQRTPSSSESHTATAQASSPAMKVRVVLLVALFSIILGMILGKRY